MGTWARSGQCGQCGQWVVWAVGGGNVGLHTCAARKPRMPSERTLGEAGRDRIPASASVQGLSVCMNGKALGDEHNASRVVTHTFVVDLDEI